MAFRFNTQMMKGIGLGVLLLSLPYSFEMSSATTGYTRASMNFRASPNGKDIGGVRKGEKFDILKDNGSWVKIKRSNGRVGWIWKKYVTIKSAAQTQQRQVHTTTTQETESYGQLVGVRNQLNIRKSPSSRSRRVGALTPNENFTIIGQAKNGWYKVKSSNGEIGYASDHYIKKVNTTSAEGIPTPTPRPQRGEFAGVTSDDLIPQRRIIRTQETPQNDEDEDLSLISAYAPASGATKEDPFKSVLQPEEGSVLLASAETSKSQIEAECNDCLTKENGPERDVFRIPDEIIAFHREQNATPATQSEREKCYGKEILAAAKKNVRRRYGNRSYSGGQCAYGVRTSLQKAGLRVGGLGHAIDYHKQSTRRSGTLAPHGFVNEISKYKTADKAPAGAILVFSGPRSDDYLRNPGKYRRGGSIVNKARGTSAGSYVGHVTVKGDDGRYYTDGRTKDPAISQRYLVGVYVLKNCKSCSSSLRKKCGG